MSVMMNMNRNVEQNIGLRPHFYPRVRQAALNKQKAQDDVEIARRQTELDTRALI
jgi:hypothetical protein